MKDTDLKHLTLKTAFLLALASGKCRSEIHAWVANKVSNLGEREKVALFPSSDFINQFICVCKQTTLTNFPKKFTLPKNGCHCQFSNLWQKVQNIKLPLSPFNFIKIFETHCIQDNYPAQESLFLYSGFVEL